MRLSIKAKQIAGVTAIVGLAVVALSALQVTRLARVGLHESEARGELLANAIFHRVRQIVTDAPDPYRAIQTDPGLLALLQSSIYGESVTGASILDAKGVIVADSDAARVGKTNGQPAGDAREPQPGAPNDLSALLGASAWDQLRVIYSRDGGTLEVRQPMTLDDQAFGSIRIGISTLLLRQELNAALQPALITAVIALVVAIVVAGLLAQLLLRPIHVIRSGLTRLGRGELGVTLDLPAGDEFGELGTSFNAVSRQLADRTLLAGQHAHLQTAVEHLEDAVALFNPAGELLFSNPAMQPLLPPAATGRPLADLLAAGHPYRQIVEDTLATRGSREPVQVQVPEPGTEPEPEHEPEHEPRTENREARTSVAPAIREVRTHAVSSPDGQLVAVLLLSRDLSHLSRVQSTLAYSRKLVALGRLTAGIAHEVKNPLNAMMIHLELLRTKIRGGAMTVSQPDSLTVGAGAADDRRRAPVGSLGLTEARLSPAEAAALEHVAVIESEVRRLDEVVQGFLKFTRPEDLRLQPVRIEALFQEILPLIQPEADRHRVAVEVSCPGGIPPVNGDAAMLRQALLNLAINACHAMPSGGTLRLTCAAAAHDRVEVRVEDTGVGVAPEDLGRIFDLYFTTKEHGTGIGLSMVYRIVQMHDGDIEVESTPGRGTTFRVFLPRTHQP